jgi:protein involved in polysaccharide export with SLBB domain
MVVIPPCFLYIKRGCNAKKRLSLKSAVLRVGFMLSFLGLVLCGASCRTGLWHRSKLPDSPVVMPASSLPQQPVNEEVKDNKTEPVNQVTPEPPRPWYKRIWSRGPAKEGAQAVAKEAPTAKPDDMVKAKTVAKPAPRPWYKRWWKKDGKNAPKSVRTGKAPNEKPADEEPPELPEEAKGMFSASGEPLIKVGYTLRISVSTGGKVEVEEQVKTVSDNGTISMPLVGAVACEGRTRKELSSRLADLYGQFLRDPVVSVDFVYEGKDDEISPWGAVVVYGMVQRPGKVNIPSTRDLTVSRAIQLAGGADPKLANQEKISVSRLQKDGKKKRIIVDLLEVAEGVREKDIKLEPGDVINVPEIRW